ncbi:MAG: phosphoglycerate mutase [Candidatus Altiarchaeales archaeon WOR_SM1_79]|nr:MAG: phosphoglycerate mutase [Candidatus Altiarchaeales archaeon WOR_SM1_79]
MKSLLIVCDGMGDRLTDGKTPLEVAYTPNMDKLASVGINGIMDSIRAGIRPGSDTAHISLFGYDPYKVYTGRGPFAAAGVGLELKKGDLALRCNFATLDENGIIIDRRAGRDEYGLDELASSLDGLEIENFDIIFKRSGGHRAALVIRRSELLGPYELSSRIIEPDPHIAGVGIAKAEALDASPQSRYTADILNEFVKRAIEILREHRINKERIEAGKLPANAILPRGVGTKPEIESFEHKYGIRGASVSGMALIKGICRTIGLDVIEVENATGHVDSNIGGKADAAIKALEEYDFVFLHIKGTDEASHDGNFDGKKNMIERVDREVMGKILGEVDLGGVNVVLTSDHATPISIKQHTADPNPIVIAGDVRTDLVTKFNERDCARGDLGRIRGRDLMNILMDLSDKAKLFGA